jgi:hypothetical protein
MYRGMLRWQQRCTCLPSPPLPPGSNVSINGKWPNCAPGAQTAYQREQEACEASRVACRACPKVAAAEERLLAELRISLPPWQTGIADFPEVEAALEAAPAATRAPRSS